MMDIGENKIILSCIRTGCIELIWQVPSDLVHHAYTSIKKNRDKLSSLAVKSQVCEEADEFAGLPILWCGQEIGEVGPIEPLPECVRQEPYSLPQGFHWVTLNSSNIEEIVKFSSKYSRCNMTSSTIAFTIQHPNTRDEWQFGIRATNGKLVAVVLASPTCINVCGVPSACLKQNIVCHRKYKGKRMLYILTKELMRRANLYNINHHLCI